MAEQRERGTRYRRCSSCGRIDVAFEWHHFAGIQKGGHLQGARRVPPMFDTDVDRVVVAKAVSAKAAEVIVAAQNRLEIIGTSFPSLGNVNTMADRIAMTRPLLK